LTWDGRTAPSSIGPNSAVICFTCVRACRTVDGRRVAYPASQLVHHCSTVVRDSRGSTYVPRPRRSPGRRCSGPPRTSSRTPWLPLAVRPVHTASQRLPCRRGRGDLDRLPVRALGGLVPQVPGACHQDSSARSCARTSVGSDLMNSCISRPRPGPWPHPFISSSRRASLRPDHPSARPFRESPSRTG